MDHMNNLGNEKQIRSSVSRLMEPFCAIEYDQATRFSLNHLWFRKIDTKGGWRSGIDQFAIQALGQITEIIFPVFPKSVARGMNLCWLNHIDGMLVIKSPVDARDLTINPSVRDHPSLVLSEPMGDGWLFEGQFNLAEDSPYVVKKADLTRWFEQETVWFQGEIETYLLARMAPQQGETLADGGVLVSDLRTALGPLAHRDLLRRIMNL